MVAKEMCDRSSFRVEQYPKVNDTRKIPCTKLEKRTMEFELLCICRMRNILSDLSVKIETALIRRYSIDTREAKLQTAISKSSRGLMEHLALFEDIVNTRMKIIKPSEKKFKSGNPNPQECSRALTDSQNQIKLLKCEIRETSLQRKRIIEDMTSEINADNSNLENIKINQKTEIFAKMEKCEDGIKKFREEKEKKLKLLEAEIDSSKSRLDILKADNILSERELYWKCADIEKRHCKILAMYDTNAGALYNTMENLKIDLNSLDDKLEKLREELAIQDVEYVKLKDERELSILKAFTENLENFEKKRAAKIIQRTWRSYYERRALRKKKKSKKRKGCVE